MNTDWQLGLACDWLRQDSLQTAVPNKPTRWQNLDILALSGIKMERCFYFPQYLSSILWFNTFRSEMTINAVWVLEMCWMSAAAAAAAAPPLLWLCCFLLTSSKSLHSSSPLCLVFSRFPNGRKKRRSEDVSLCSSSLWCLFGLLFSTHWSSALSGSFNNIWTYLAWCGQIKRNSPVFSLLSLLITGCFYLLLLTYFNLF